MYAIAHVRGGGDLGEYWHQEGMLLNKRNTFTDFIACAEHLIKARPCPALALEPCANPDTRGPFPVLANVQKVELTALEMI